MTRLPLLGSIWPSMRGRVARAALLGLSLHAVGAHSQSDRLVGLVTPLVAQRPLKMGVTLVHLNDTFWKGVAYGIVDEAKRSNVQVVWVSVAGAYGNTRQQFAQLNTLKALGVNYIALGAASFDGYEPVIHELKAAGIKVIAAAVPVNSASVVFGVTQDDALIGRQLAQAICSKSAAAKIVAIPGPAGAEWARLRYVGFMDQVKHCPGTLVFPGAFRGSVDLQEGLTQTADLLQKHPEAEFVYTPQMSLGMGAVQAGRQLGRHVQVVSSAMIGAAVPMLVDGRMLAVVSEPAIIMGRLIVQYAIRDAEQKDKPNFIQPTGAPYPYLLAPATLITSVNAARFPLGVYKIPPSDFQLDAIQ